MTISDTTHRIPISDIKIARDERQRRTIRSEDLQASISRLGLIHPIVITRDLWLRTGERRLDACRALGHQTILCRFAEDLSPIESQILELEENVKRQDLHWKEIVSTVSAIHSLYSQLDPKWNQERTTEALSIDKGLLSVYLRVAKDLLDPRVAEASTVNEAINILRRRDQRAMGDALQGLMEEEPPTHVKLTETVFLDSAGTLIPKWNGPTPYQIINPPSLEPILLASFLDWAPSYTGPKFNFIHCDFPYGINLFAGPQGRGIEPTQGYEDKPELYWQLLECFCSNLDNFMSISSHLMFWYSFRFHSETLSYFAQHAPSLEFRPFPLIWIKSDGAGIASDPRQGPRHVYETCLLASRSKRQIIQVKSDAYSAPTDKTLHPSTKPEPMLRHFFQMLVDEQSRVFDPTAGSGAALRAAESLGAKSILGLEIDPQSARLANKALLDARTLRRASALQPKPSSLEISL